MFNAYVPEELQTFIEENELNLENIKPKMLTKRLAEVERERVEWLWDGFLPKGKLVIIDGMPSMGKSTLTAEIAAIVSSGRNFPFANSCEPMGVLFIAPEDGDADTIRPRVEAAGGDLNLVHSGNSVMTNGYSETLDLYRHIEQLQKIIEDYEMGLVIIDPIMALLGDRIDSHRDQDVRKITTPLSALADKLKVTIIAVRHPNKSASTNAIMRGGGSIGLIGAARVGLVVGKESEESNDRILAVSKNNLSANYRSLKFQLINDEKFGCAKIDWIGESLVSANQLYVEQNPDDKNLTEEAIGFLISILQNGSMKSKDVQNHARDENISEKALRRAREKVCLVERKNSGVNHESHWSLKPQYRTLAPLIDGISGDEGHKSSEPPTPLFD